MASSSYILLTISLSHYAVYKHVHVLEVSCRNVLHTHGFIQKVVSSVRHNSVFD